MTWINGPFLAFDTETTGTNCDTDRIVTATTVLIESGREPVVTSWLIDPGVPIPEAATAVHGITDGHALAHGRPPAECIQEIVEVITGEVLNGIPILAFNACFDLTILDREARRHGAPSLPTDALVLDPFVIDKHCSYRKGKRTLSAQCEYYGVRHGGAHDATADALAAARVMWMLARRYPTVAEKSLAELHDAQVQWAAEQAASFRDYLIGKGQTQDLPHGEWPMRAWVDPTAAAA